MGLHHLRLLRARLPDRARAPRALLPAAPAPGDDGRRVPAGAQGRLRRLREPVQPLGAAGGHARRLGEATSACRCSRARSRRRTSTGSTTWARRSRSTPRAEDRDGVREDPAGRGRAIRDPRAPARVPPGECVRRAGNEMLFQSLAKALVETLNGLGVTRIVTCDPHAFNALANEYPEFGGRYEVVHHTQLIDRAHPRGQDRRRDAPSRACIYHEPCYLARHNGEYEAPRRVLAADLASDTPPEFALARDKAMCCGAGGARMWMEEHTGKRINVLRAEQALERAPKVIATACPYCATDAARRRGAARRAGHPHPRHRRAGGRGNRCGLSGRRPGAGANRSVTWDATLPAVLVTSGRDEPHAPLRSGAERTREHRLPGFQRQLSPHHPRGTHGHPGHAGDRPQVHRARRDAAAPQASWT